MVFYHIYAIPPQELNKSESVLRARAIVAFHLGNFRSPSPLSFPSFHLGQLCHLPSFVLPSVMSVIIIAAILPLLTKHCKHLKHQTSYVTNIIIMKSELEVNPAPDCLYSKITMHRLELFVLDDSVFLPLDFKYFAHREKGVADHE